MIRNMRSVGLNLQRWAEAGLLRIWAVRPTEFGLENHLAIVSGLLAEHAPAVAVVDGTASLLGGHAHGEVISMLARQFNLFKARGITTMATILTEGDAETAVGVSSQADTWLLVRNDESNGERNRLLFVLKSRGSANSNQVREFVLTDHGVELVDVYVGPAGVMTGSARLSQETRDRDAKLQQQEDLQRRTRELRRGITQGQAQLAALQDELAAQAGRAGADRGPRRAPGSRCPGSPGGPWALSAGQIPARTMRKSSDKPRRATPVATPMTGPPSGTSGGDLGAAALRDRALAQVHPRAREPAARLRALAAGPISHRGRGPAGEPAPGGRRSDRGRADAGQEAPAAYPQDRRRPLRHRAPAGRHAAATRTSQADR